MAATADRIDDRAQGANASAQSPGALAYRSARTGRHDEAFDTEGRVRSHWEGFLDWAGRSGVGEIDRAARELGRMRDESGIAFTARATATESGPADPIPVVLNAPEWGFLEAGLAQRARLVEALLVDIYGPQRTLHQGLLPPGLVFGTGAFAAHAAGWEQAPARFTYAFEADVARAADGRWMILADRIDTPLGDGWLIANRIATSQAMSEPFVEFGIRRLATHFSRFQELLDSLTGWEGRLALLTGGEHDPRFFSHAYLARYLNATLVEPADLTVRDDAAFVKTLDGLKKVDVMLRGVADHGVDALHSPDRAAPGAPAMTEAARAGSITLANGIGASVLAYRALAPFAHVLCPALLDEELMITDAPCLWLGDPAARDQVLDQLPFWRIEPIAGHAPGRDGFAPNAHEEPMRRAAIERLLRHEPERFAAVATPPLASTPVWSGGGLAPSEWMMRVFASWTGEEWSIAPGGVAATVEPGCPPPSLGFGKDVWVLPEDDTPAAALPGSLLSSRLAGAHLRRTGRELLSRVADEVFWLGRNAERAESTLRLLSVCLGRYLSGNRIDSDPAMLGELISLKAELDPSLGPVGRFRDALGRLLGSEEEVEGLPATLATLHSGAVRARMSISDESWRDIDRLAADPRWRGPIDLRASGDLARLIEESLRNLSAFAGSAQENLTRNFAWRFLEMGRRIERGTQIARLARHFVGQIRPNEESLLRAWLRYSDSASAYRSRYMMVPTASAVIDLLILDESNPRALAFQIAQLEAVLSALPAEAPYRRPEHRRALALLTELRMIDADRLAEEDEDGALRPALNVLCDRCIADLAEISTLLAGSFFAHSDVPVALVSQARIEGAP